jgi:sortase A
MRVVIEQQSLKRLLVWTQRILFGLSFPLLVYCLFVMLESWMFQQHARLELSRRLEAENEARSAPLARPASSIALPNPIEKLLPDSLIGRLEIPRLDISVMVAEGTSDTTLSHAVGHIPDTGMPGQAGRNIGLAGHRDTFFRPLQNIRTNDLIVITTTAGTYRYHVVSMQVVGPTQVSVLKPDGGEILTLVTCFPFQFVGAAPDRFIVRAERKL